MKTQPSEFLKAHKKVRAGKKTLSDRDFIKYKSIKADSLNSLGKFFSNKKVSLKELEQIADQFNKRTYELTKYICVILPKGADSYRPILVPAPRDRILFSYILEVIKNDFLEEINKYKVFGSGKRTDLPNIRKIIEEIQKESQKHKYILKIDVCKFFPSIDQDILLNKISGYIKDPYILEIIRKSFNNNIEPKFIKSFSKEKELEIINSLGRGIPQGCAYSPLMANFYALDLDMAAEESGYVSFRYLDDMVVFTESEEQAIEFFGKLTEIAKKLNLKIHPIEKRGNNKTYIQQTNHTFEYLGIEVKSDGTLKIPLEKISKEILLIKKGIFNRTTIKKFGASKVVDVLEAQFNGWKMYYQKNFSTAYLFMENIDSYNKNLKEYYEKVLYHSGKAFMNELLQAGFDLNNSKFYL